MVTKARENIYEEHKYQSNIVFAILQNKLNRIKQLSPPSWPMN